MRPASHSVAAMELLEPRLLLATFIVTTPFDSGAGSLRQAILDANASPGHDTIVFSISQFLPRTILLQSPLPAITDQITVNGINQQIPPTRIRLDGEQAGAGADGLRITAGESIIRDLVITRFDGFGVRIDSPAGGNRIAGSFIGTTVGGATDLGNQAGGVVVIDSPNNTIGGTVESDRNVISGNFDGTGIVIEGGGSSGNRIQGNFIGSGVDGTGWLANFRGIHIDNAPNNTIGGVPRIIIGDPRDPEITRNVILGNRSGGGILISGGGASGNVIQGNHVGLDVTGMNTGHPQNAPNSGPGISIEDAPNNRIGGTSSGARNVISGHFQSHVAISGAGASGNVVQGNYIGARLTGTSGSGDSYGVLINNASNNLIGGITPAARNLISANWEAGVGIFGIGAQGNVVQGNYIGTDVTGTEKLGNRFYGVRISNGIGNTIGGVEPGAGNLISGNSQDGVLIDGASASNNVVQGNRIGTDHTGTAALPNGSVVGFDGAVVGSGIRIFAARNNLIGGVDPAAGNIISGNRTRGVNIVEPLAGGNILQGNYIGTTIDGTEALPNGLEGVRVLGAPGTVIGGAEPGAGNLISGNASHGVEITGAAAAGTLIQGNTIGLGSGGSALPNEGDGIHIESVPRQTIGGASSASRNVISGNTGDGIHVIGSREIQVLGNYIGTNPSGAAARANEGRGVYLLYTHSSVIGAPGAGNVISGNAGHGLVIEGAASTGNTVQGNRIGTNAAGTGKLPNNNRGIFLTNGASSNLIGGTGAGAGNLISGNGLYGVMLFDGASANLLQGNFIGTDITGTIALGNRSGALGGYGIVINNATGNTIGGAEPGARNVISDNGFAGISLNGRFNDVAGNRILGNYIGTDVTGTVPMPNEFYGIDLFHAHGVIIGGSGPGEGNVIAETITGAISGRAINLEGGGGNLIRGNWIGVAADGTTPLGARHGIAIFGRSSNNTIGGTGPGEGNVIAFTDGSFSAGVRVFAGSTGNAILGNSIFSNTRIGIELIESGIITPRANNGQNHPDLASAVAGGGSITITGTLDSAPDTTFRVEFFANTEGHSSGFGEGERFIGFAEVATDGTGIANFSVTLADSVPEGHAVTATATDPDGNTSEFSAWVVVEADLAPPEVLTAVFDHLDRAHPLHFSFSTDVSASLTAADLVLENLTTGVMIDPADVALSYDSGSDTATFTFPGLQNGRLSDGVYRATLPAGSVQDTDGNTLAEDHVLEFFVLAGDANRDRRVDGEDFLIWQAGFGTQSGALFSQGDFNYDGRIDGEDFLIWQANFGSHLPPSAPPVTGEAAAADEVVADRDTDPEPVAAEPALRGRGVDRRAAVAPPWQQSSALKAMG